MIVSSIALHAPRRHRSRHRRRAHPQRPVQQLRAAGGPLFILAADLMNIGSLDRRAVEFLSRAGRPLPRRPRPRQRRREHDLRRHVRFGDRRRRRHRPHHHRHDEPRTSRYPYLLRGRDNRRRRGHWADHPTVDPNGASAHWCPDASIGYLFLGGFVPGVMPGLAFMVTNSIIARSTQLSGRTADPAARGAEDHASTPSRR